MQLARMAGLLITSLSVVSLGIAGCTQQREFDTAAQEPQGLQTLTPVPHLEDSSQRSADVPYVPTPNEVVAEMLQLANVSGDDILYDLGSGDGRIPITAAQKFGTRGIGIDINPELIKRSRENAQEAGVVDQTEFRQQDLFETDLSEATVVTLYLLPDVNLKLRSKLLEELKPGTRIVSHDFDMGNWKPEQVVQIQGPVRQHTLYTWVVPKKVPENLR